MGSWTQDAAGNWIDDETGQPLAADPNPRFKVPAPAGPAPAPYTGPNGAALFREQRNKDDLGATLTAFGGTPVVKPPEEPPAGPTSTAPPALTLVPPPPQGPVTRTESQTTRTREVIGKDEKKLLGDIDKGNEAQVEQVRRQGQLAQDIAKEKDRQADAEAAYRAEKQQRVNELAAQTDQRINAATGELNAQYEKYRGMEMKDFFAEGRNHNQVVAKLAVALGTLGSSLSGGHNDALSIIKDKIAHDFALQRENIEKQKDSVEFARSGVRDAESSRERAFRNLELKEAAAYDAVASKWASNISKFGAGVEAAKTDANVLNLQQTAMEKRQKVLEGAREKIVSTFHKTVAEGGAGRASGSHPNDDHNIYGPGGQVVARVTDSKQATKVNELNAAYGQVRGIIEELKRSYKEHGRVIPGSEEAQKREGLVAAGALAIKNNEQLGQLVGGDWKLIENQIGKGSAVYVIDPTPKLEQAAKQVEEKHVRMLDSHGLPGKDLVQMFNPVSTANAAESKPMGDRDLAEAMKWLNENPNDPRAPAIREALRSRRRN